jgi:hypothetical protein
MLTQNAEDGVNVQYAGKVSTENKALKVTDDK